MITERGEVDAPTCTSCHGEHGILRTDDDRSRVSPSHVAEATCAPCHESAVLNEKYGIKTGPAEGLSKTEIDKLSRLAKRIYRALHLCGFARLDFRMRNDGKVFLLEANANPDLTYGEDFAESAESAGITYEQLVSRIVNLGLSYEPEWRQYE